MNYTFFSIGLSTTPSSIGFLEKSIVEFTKRACGNTKIKLNKIIKELHKIVLNF